jgi:hypothetical protein
LLEYLPRPLAIESVGTTFPDCKAIDSSDGSRVCIEFELKSSHFFRDHRGRLEDCHWVVCWEDDVPKKPAGSPTVVSLQPILEQAAPGFILERLPAKAAQPDRFAHRVAGLSSLHQQIIEQLRQVDWARLRLEVCWPETNRACFTIREPEGVEYFKVGSGGSLTVPFSRWRAVPQNVKAQLTADLNQAVGHNWFRSEGKKSRDLLELFEHPGSVEAFLKVWESFAVQRANTRMEPTRRRSRQRPAHS